MSYSLYSSYSWSYLSRVRRRIVVLSFVFVFVTTNINEQNYDRYSSNNSSSLSLPSSKKEKQQRQQQRAVVDELLQEIDHSIYSQQLGENHPGYDCFVIHSSILQIFVYIYICICIYVCVCVCVSSC